MIQSLSLNSLLPIQPLLIELLEEVYTQQAENLNVFFSPVFYLGTVAMAWVFASLIITAIFTWVWERVWIST